MQVIVTGGLGYIGSLLLARMRPGIRRDALVIDSRSAPDDGFSRSPSPVTLVHDDIRTAALDALISRAQVVVHLAAVVGASESEKDPRLVWEVNVDGTRRVAEACHRTGARLLFISTTSVYGSQHHLVNENSDSADLHPETPYAETKLLGERMVEALGRRGLRYTILRFGTAFGASVNMRLHTAVNRLCWQACVGQPLTVWRTAREQRRPYLHIDDAVGAIQFVLDRRLFENQAYNVVTTNATMAEVLQAIGRDVSSLTVRYVDSPLMNTLSYAVAAERIRREGFVARGDLAAGIRATIDRLRRSRCSAA